MTGSDWKLRIAGWGMVAVFAVLLAIGVIATEEREIGYILMLALPAFLMALPVAIALMIFAGARGPILGTLGALTALGGAVFMFVMAWTLWSSHSSTAAIGLLFIPIEGMLAVGLVAVFGKLADDGLSAWKRRR